MFGTCPTCNENFLLTPKRKKYCSATCRAKGVGLAKGQKLHLYCLVCGKALGVKPCHYRRDQGKYCSSECQHVAQRNDFTQCNISSAELHSLYVDQHFSARQIAQRYGVSPTTIHKKMAHYNILSRTRSESLVGHNGNKGRKLNLTGKQRQAMSQRMKERWAQPEYRRKVVQAIMAGAHVSPTTAERRLEKILQEAFPNEWKYVGDGQLVIGGLCPDFANINGQKLVIEMFGDYWHGKGANRRSDYESYRKAVFSKYGFGLLVIWERELKSETAVVETVKGFMEVSLCL